MTFGTALVALGLVGLWSWNQWGAARPARLRQQAREAAHRGRWAEVEKFSRRCIELDPRAGEAWMLLARAAHEQRNAAESARILEAMPGECPEKNRALEMLAELQLGPLAAPHLAEQTYQRILERQPDSPLAHQRLIFLYAITFQREELMRQVRRAMELRCEPIEAYVYLFLADELPFSNGAELNLNWAAATPDSERFRVAGAIHLANSLKGPLQRGDLEDVLRTRKLADNKDRVLAELFQRFPENLELLAWYLERAIEQGDRDRAVELLARLPAPADGDNRFWRYAGWAHSQFGRTDEALADCDQALRVHPLDWTTRHLQATLRREQHDLNEVQRLERIVQKGYDITLALYQIPDARAVPERLLARLADYAEECGDELYATSLRRRMSLATAAGERNYPAGTNLSRGTP